MSAQQTAPLQQYLQPLLDHKLLIVVTALLTVGLGVAAGLAVPVTYASTSSVLVYPVSGDPTKALESDDTKIDMPTELRIATSQAVVAIVAERLAEQSINVAPDVLAEGVTAGSTRESTILDISFQAGTPGTAQAGADAFAESYLQFRTELAEGNKVAAETAINSRITILKERLSQVDSQLSRAANGSAQRVDLTVEKTSIEGEIAAQQEALAALSTPTIDATKIIDQAQRPEAPEGLSLLQIIIGSVAGGLAIGVIMAHVVSAIRSSTAPQGRGDRGHVERRTGTEPAPQAAAAGEHARADRSAVIAAALDGEVRPPAQSSFLAPPPEATAADEHVLTVGAGIDGLIERFQQLGTDGPVVALSVGEDDPGTAVTVALELGDALQALGARVLVIEADTEKPILDKLLALDPSPGLAEVLTGEATLGHAAQAIGRMEGLDALTIGSVTGMTAAAIAGAPFERLMAEAKVRYHSILVVGGSIEGSTIVPAVASLSNGVIVGTERAAGQHAGVALSGRLAELSAPTLAVLSAVSATKVVDEAIAAAPGM